MFQLLSNNAKCFKAPTVELSTVKLPSYARYAPKYESCLFSADDSEVLAQYHTLSQAVEGHAKLAIQYGLTNHIQ